MVIFHGLDHISHCYFVIDLWYMPYYSVDFIYVVPKVIAVPKLYVDRSPKLGREKAKPLRGECAVVRFLWVQGSLIRRRDRNTPNKGDMVWCQLPHSESVWRLVVAIAPERTTERQ